MKERKRKKEPWSINDIQRRKILCRVIPDYISIRILFSVRKQNIIQFFYNVGKSFIIYAYRNGLHCF